MAVAICQRWRHERRTVSPGGLQPSVAAAQRSPALQTALSTRPSPTLTRFALPAWVAFGGVVVVVEKATGAESVGVPGGEPVRVNRLNEVVLPVPSLTRYIVLEEVRASAGTSASSGRYVNGVQVETPPPPISWVLLATHTWVPRNAPFG